MLDNFQQRMPTIAEILSNRITKGGKSKTYVASELKVTEKTIENYMRGKREPDATTLVKLSKLLDFNLNELSEQSVPEPIPMANEDQPEYNTPLPLGDLKVTLKDHFDLLKQIAEEAKREKERLYNLLENKLGDLLSNSKTILADLAQVAQMTRADDLTMMDDLDRIEGREVGTSSTEASIVEHAFSHEEEDIDRNDATRKEDNAGKGKQKRKA